VTGTAFSVGACYVNGFEPLMRIAAGFEKGKGIGQIFFECSTSSIRYGDFR
jgi:hypothetical protein